MTWESPKYILTEYSFYHMCVYVHYCETFLKNVLNFVLDFGYTVFNK